MIGTIAALSNRRICDDLGSCTTPHDRFSTASAGQARQRKGEHYRSQPACWYRGRNERQGHEPSERESGKHRDRPRDRRPDNDIRGICRVSHGEAIVEGLLRE